MMKSKFLGTAAAFVLIAPLAFADEVQRLAGLSKDQFMAEYEETFPEILALQKELFVRLDPELAETALSDEPMTQAEREAMACNWDKLNEIGKLEDLAQQFLSYERLRALADERPELDFVDLVMNEEIRDMQTEDISDEVFSAMSKCGTAKAAAQRMNLDAAVWQKIAEVAAARGYSD